MDLPLGAKTVAEISNDYRPNPLGPRSELIDRIRKMLPDANFKDPTWGIFDGPGFSIEFNKGSKEICDSFMLHVRGGGSAMTVVGRLLQHLAVRGIDCQTGDFFVHDAAEESFAKWQTFRDQVVRAKPAG